MARCLDMITHGAAKLLNRRDYGIAVGHPADIVVLDSNDGAMAVAELAQPLCGFKRGRPSFTRVAPQLHLPQDSR
jgi:cytosine deaminase